MRDWILPNLPICESANLPICESLNSASEPHAYTHPELVRIELLARAEDGSERAFGEDALVAIAEIELERSSVEQDAATAAHDRIARVDEVQRRAHDGIGRRSEAVDAEPEMRDARRNRYIYPPLNSYRYYTPRNPA